MLPPSPNPTSEARHIHFIGMSGRATAGLAVALKQQGWRVTGSDVRAYGVGKQLLDDAGLRCEDGFDPAHLPADAELVLVGSAMTADNPELTAAREAGLPCLTFPELLARITPAAVFNVQVAGTNGKTSTTAMLLQLLHAADRRPGFLIGGVHPALGQTLRLPAVDGADPLAVWEADESRCARWLNRPKFSLLPADAVVLTSLAPDHPETFDSEEAYFEAFRQRLRDLPANGFVVAHRHDLDRLQPGVIKARVVAVESAGRTPDGAGGRSAGDPTTHRITPLATAGRFLLDGQPWQLGVPGPHQSANAALALLAAEALGVDLQQPSIAAALADYQGVRGRSDVLREAPIPVINDEAYHPDALAATFEAARLRFPDRRWHLVFRPRYLWQAGGYIESGLPDVLARADVAHLFFEEVPVDQPLPGPGEWRACALRDRLIAKGVETWYHETLESFKTGLNASVRPGDAVLFCASASNFQVQQHLLDTIDQLAGIGT